MPIEFRCTQCAKLLRTGDDTAGKQAKCPACQTIVTVPSPHEEHPPQGPQEPSPFGQSGGQPSQSPFDGAGTMPSASMDSDNPYQAPPEYAAQPSCAAASGGEIRPTQIEFGETLNRAWTAFTDQIGMCILVFFLCAVMNFVVGQAAQFGSMAIAAAAQNEIVGVLVSLPLSLASQLFGIWIGIGQAIFFLKIARGQEAPISDVFTGGPYLLRILGATVMIVLGLIASLFVCSLPGVVLAAIGGATNSEPLATVGIGTAAFGAIVGAAIFTIVMLMIMQFYYLIIDRNMGIMEGFSASREIMDGNKLTVFSILLVVGIIGTFLIVCTCGIGMLVVMPYMGVLYAIIYLCCTGQPTMSDFRQMQYQPPQLNSQGYETPEQ